MILDNVLLLSFFPRKGLVTIHTCNANLDLTNKLMLIHLYLHKEIKGCVWNTSKKEEDKESYNNFFLFSFLRKTEHRKITGCSNLFLSLTLPSFLFPVHKVRHTRRLILRVDLARNHMILQGSFFLE